MSRPASPDYAALGSGLVLIAVGSVLLCDRLELLDLRLAAFGPIASGAVGAVLIAIGLARSRGRRD